MCVCVCVCVCMYICTYVHIHFLLQGADANFCDRGTPIIVGLFSLYIRSLLTRVRVYIQGADVNYWDSQCVANVLLMCY
jgi:hypothetical protein